MKRAGCLIVVFMVAMPGLALAEEPVYFADANLKAAVEQELGISDPTPNDMLSLTYLHATDRAIVDLTGLQHATYLATLYLWDNQINDLSALSGLTNLTALHLGTNQISNISALSGLTNLRNLVLYQNQIRDISALSGLTGLIWLQLNTNQISNISALSGLTNLKVLELTSNDVRDISALSGLVKLEVLHLRDNRISNISALSGLINLWGLWLNYNQIGDISALSGLTNLTVLALDSNPLNQDACNIYIPQILANNPGIDLRYDPCVEPPPPVGTTLSGVVFEDKNEDEEYNSGEEISGAVISMDQGVASVSGSDGRYLLEGLSPGVVRLEVSIDGTTYAYRYYEIGQGENDYDILVNRSAVDSFNICSANIVCANIVPGLIPYVGLASDAAAVALDVCAAKQRAEAGDDLGSLVAIIMAIVETANFVVNTIFAALGVVSWSIGDLPGEAIDAVVSVTACLEAQLWEYADENCGGYASCLWEGFKWLEESVVGIFTGSPVDIRVIDSQGNVMELDTNGYTANGLSSPGWIFKGPDDKELALIFDADDDYTVQIVGRPEAGASSTFYLQMMQQSAGGSQQIHTYTNVSISAQGVAVAQIGDNPVLEVDVDGDGTVDLNLLPDSLAMQVVPLLPSSDKNKAGRTMPVKFSLRRPERVDPAMPFVYDEDLEIRIYDSADPGTILQTSRHGDTARDYRIDTADELYITNFRTKKEPAEYVVEIWRTDLAFQVGSFTFQTLK